ncbi:uncharacterized protein ATNIH1004_008696 [Aspergillus tanneri]|uniref:Uncharacterized protein n=1 Tax=Aspergillus tanneri TaxID=1220188 RepID=A0A5M9MBS3_9EURO|nr:uncharacterized protein ATNIH1004_008696 [Aspergillus tanneri]KAA8644492.1 hypothetical protein ATNIH1004_008696 [Aspergillus tanneri]
MCSDTIDEKWDRALSILSRYMWFSTIGRELVSDLTELLWGGYRYVTIQYPELDGASTTNIKEQHAQCIKRYDVRGTDYGVFRVSLRIPKNLPMPMDPLGMPVSVDRRIFIYFQLELIAEHASFELEREP